MAERTVQLSLRLDELAVINSVQGGLVREMDIQGIYELVGEKIREIFHAQIFDIVTYDRKTNLLEDHYSYENGDRTLIGKREPSGFRKIVIDTKQVLLINKDLDKRSQEINSKMISGKRPKSALFVPLISGGHVTGMISLQDLDRENAFPESSVNLLTTLANSMSVALESARRFDETNRLLKETEQRKAELAIINTVQEGLVREVNMHAIYELMGKRLCEMFNTQTVMIRTFDQEAGTETWNYAIERGARLYSDPRPVIWANKELTKSKKYILINENYLEVARSYGSSGVSKGLPPKSALFVPLIVNDIVRGSISLQNVETENAFSESDVRLLTTMASSMSVALENARLFEETKLLLTETAKGKKNVELLSDIGKKITASLDFETIFYELYEHINQLVDASIFGVGIYHAERQQIEYSFAIENGMRYQPYTRDTSDKNQLPVWCIENRMPILLNDVPNEYSRYISSYETKERLLEDGSVSLPPLSIIYIPLIVKDKILGLFQFRASGRMHTLNIISISCKTWLPIQA